MTDQAVLTSLVERVQAATGPDRELDCLIALTVDGFFIDGEDGWGRPKYCYRDAGGQVSPGQAHDMLVRRYTASLDAALALTERLLPGFYWDVALGMHSFDGHGPYWACAYRFSADDAEGVGFDFDGEPTQHPGKTPALALLAAMLRALEVQNNAG